MMSSSISMTTLLSRKRLKHEFREFFTLRPALFYPVLRATGRLDERAVADETEIVIEGFPRSANSFAVGAFQAAQSQPVQVAHHYHAAAQILEGVRRQLPTLLLIREPISTVVSFRALEMECDYYDKKQDLVNRRSPLRDFIGYMRFYERVWPAREHYTIGHFQQVVTDFGVVIEAVNEKFGTDFMAFDHNAEAVKAVGAERGFHAMPNEVRANFKKTVVAEVDSVREHPLVKQAQALHQRYLDYSLNDAPQPTEISASAQ